MARIGWGLVAAALGITLAGASVVVQRPVTMIAGNVCGASADDPDGYCYAELPVGGWPFAFLYDDPATSVRGVLGPEDRLRPWPFAADAAAFASVAGALMLVAGRVRRRRVR